MKEILAYIAAGCLGCEGRRIQSGVFGRQVCGGIGIQDTIDEASDISKTVIGKKE